MTVFQSSLCNFSVSSSLCPNHFLQFVSYNRTNDFQINPLWSMHYGTNALRCKMTRLTWFCKISKKKKAPYAWEVKCLCVSGHKCTNARRFNLLTWRFDDIRKKKKKKKEHHFCPTYENATEDANCANECRLLTWKLNHDPSYNISNVSVF